MILRFFIPLFFLDLHSEVVQAGGLDDFLTHSASTGTQNKLGLNVTNADLPHLPSIHGFMGTHGTFRFMDIKEQTAWIVGEPKHGLWRYQDNGLIREYRKKGKIGLRDGDDENAGSLTQAQQDIIAANYGAYIPEESWEGYKDPADRISKGDGSYDKQKDFKNFVDLSIYHPKYKGKYDSHPAIDLPLFYCTMSQNDYPYVYNSWKYAVEQPRANVIGPLGIRAGLDVKENNLNVIRFDFIHQAGLWVQVGDNDPNGGDRKMTTNASHIQNVNYQRVSAAKMNIEGYMVERPFFNKRYLFIIAVMENKAGASEFTYLRNAGAYWEGLVKNKKNGTGVNHKVRYAHKVFVDNYPNKGNTSERTIYGLPVYGTHHPDRAKHQMTGGACPERGGDWSTYPWGNTGAGFPTNLEEVTPICDAVVIDMKLAWDLWVDTWNDPALGLANSAYGTKLVSYAVDRNVYGQYTDKYLLDKGEVNPDKVDLTPDGTVVKPNEKSRQNRTFIQLRYVYNGKMIDYKKVDGLKSTKKTCPSLPPKPKVTCPPAVTQKPVTCPPVTQCPVAPTDDPTTGPAWGQNILIIVCVVLVFMLLELIAIIVICDRIQKNKSNKSSAHANNGKQNPSFDPGSA